MKEEMINEFLKIYNRFRLDFYRNLNFGEDEDSLTVSESFCLEVINGLDQATVRDVAAFMKISQPNAAYKISNLEEKGYITKNQSQEDKRIFYLNVTDKYYGFLELKNENVVTILDEIMENLTSEEIETTTKMMGRINENMPSPNEYLKK
ncbi:MAG: winged helix DNA-binding protein [Tissierellia bacterium]|nr:winged helix DNA-binding protein [Tissierellia bacterium]